MAVKDDHGLEWRDATRFSEGVELPSLAHAESKFLSLAELLELEPKV